MFYSDDELALRFAVMDAIDNCMFMVSFVVTSPRSGAVADVGISDVSFVRTGHSPSDVVKQQSDLVDFYANGALVEETDLDGGRDSGATWTKPVLAVPEHVDGDDPGAGRAPAP